MVDFELTQQPASGHRLRRTLVRFNINAPRRPIILVRVALFVLLNGMYTFRQSWGEPILHIHNMCGNYIFCFCFAVIIIISFFLAWPISAQGKLEKFAFKRITQFCGWTFCQMVKKTLLDSSFFISAEFFLFLFLFFDALIPNRLAMPFANRKKYFKVYFQFSIVTI